MAIKLFLTELWPYLNIVILCSFHTMGYGVCVIIFPKFLTDHFNAIALRKAKIVYNFGLSE